MQTHRVVKQGAFLIIRMLIKNVKRYLCRVQSVKCKGNLLTLNIVQASET